MLGISIDGGDEKQRASIGDTLIFSSFPENYFFNYGERVVDINKYWFFDFNPFVVRDKEHTRDINLLAPASVVKQINLNRSFTSLAERTKCIFDHSMNIVLRHPRLYKNEDKEINPRGIVLHTTGATCGALPDYIIEHIYKKYKGWDVIQVGGLQDKQSPFKSKLGLKTRWEIADIISENALFIGVDSGLMHIANCYPRIAKKIILMQDSLENLVPLDPLNGHSHWFDYGTSYFNISGNDIGMTYSYLKL